MAKTIKKEDINEKAIIASFLQDVPVDHESLVRENNESPGEPPAQKTEPPKDEIRRRRSKEHDYETLFVRESSITARTGKMVYIRRDFHDTIQTICRVIGDNAVSLSGYIDNILVHHFETFGGEITRLYNEKHKGINIIKDLEK
ncbi:DUF3408 domain-containing protein [Maribellus sp. YY47]|uniref:DUF3408 domain-containing protein n=1 Tax=Maribellus sp. YY47 TaxID=2929486 RepID=UPI0020010A27|nr:DUF3408 domain-containing protein [Maribellus sp. YY47]MCK3683057.1 DUF3408 domain-containing protein [Maribellus sp. YY47]